MKNLTLALKTPQLRWLPKHLQHITENIVFKQRNISFLAINAIFRQKTHKITASNKEKGNFIIEDYVALQRNDMLRRKAEILTVIFYLDKHDNIVVVTAYSENDTDYS
jgi:hypothetical protein